MYASACSKHSGYALHPLSARLKELTDCDFLKELTDCDFLTLTPLNRYIGDLRIEVSHIAGDTEVTLGIPTRTKTFQSLETFVHLYDKALIFTNEYAYTPEGTERFIKEVL
jgi:hypothetical protein